jgi:hypothetical protein
MYSKEEIIAKLEEACKPLKIMADEHLKETSEDEISPTLKKIKEGIVPFVIQTKYDSEDHFVEEVNKDIQARGWTLTKYAEELAQAYTVLMSLAGEMMK